MHCPGSVSLIAELKLPESDEPDYRSLGTAAHLLACTCLTDGSDAWEHVSQKFDKHVADDNMVDAVQVYLDECRSLPEGQSYVEFPVDAPEFHHDFYGTLDFGHVVGDTLYIRDYKHGEGVAVDVEDNPQIMYYAYGLLRNHPEVATVDLAIVQPRGFHPDGAIRRWTCDASHILWWAAEVLRPAMDRTEVDHSLDAGSWCRFCPAKLVCPLMSSLFGAAATADQRVLINLSDEAVGRSYGKIEAAKSYIRALEAEALRRLATGIKVPGTKLVAKKANRVWTTGAAEPLMNALGQEAMTKPELKSPAEMEKVSAAAKKLVKELAYTPQTGYTVATADDKRREVSVQTAAEIFTNWEDL